METSIFFLWPKYDKICVFPNNHMKIIIVKKNLELNDLGFLCYSFLNVYIPLPWYHQHGKIDETVNFQNFRKLFTNKFAAFFFGILTPHFQTWKIKRSNRKILFPTRHVHTRRFFFCFFCLIRYLKSIFTIVKKLIYIDDKKNVIKWKNWNW